MLVEDLDTWSNIVETREKRSELRIAENWNIGKDGEEREILNNQTI